MLVQKSHRDNETDKGHDEKYHAVLYKIEIYRVFPKKVARLKLFGIFSLQLRIFECNFANLLGIYIQYIYQFL